MYERSEAHVFRVGALRVDENPHTKCMCHEFCMEITNGVGTLDFPDAYQLPPAYYYYSSKQVEALTFCLNQ